MAALQFAFDQKQINSLINGTQGKSLIISIFSEKNPTSSKSNLFLAAQLAEPKTNVAIQSASVPVGCPNPPGWKNASFIPTITAAQLAPGNFPRFIVPADQISKIPPDVSGDIFTTLEGFTDGATLGFQLSFKNNNTPVNAMVL